MMAGLLPFVAMAEEEPRISEVLPVAGIPWIDPAFADAEGDGDTDLYFLDGTGGIANVWLENLGGRRFSPARVVSYLHRIGNDQDVWTDPIDVDGDGRTDLLIGAYWQQEGGGTSPNAAFIDATGKVVRRERLAAANSHGWRPVDLDGNRRMALVDIERGPTRQHSTVRILKYAAGGGLVPWSSQSFNVEAELSDRAIYAKDVDGDGDTDLILEGGDRAYILKRTGSTTFAEVPYSIELPIASIWADLDGDGDLDTFSVFGPNATWSINEGNFVFTAPQIHSLAPEEFGYLQSPFHVASAAGQAAVITIPRPTYDRDEVNTASIVRYRFGSWEKILDQELGGSIPVSAGARDWTVAGYADLDRDGRVDTVMRAEATWPEQAGFETGPARIAVAWGTTNGGFAEPIWIGGTPMRNVSPLPGDFDRDGDQDIVMGPDVAGRTLLIKNNGKGTFDTNREITELLPPWLTTLGGRAYVIDTADLDGNGRLDLVVRYERDGSTSDTPDHGMATAFGYGNGTFIVPALQRVAAANNRNALQLTVRSFLENLREVFAGTKTWSQLTWSAPTAQQLRQIPIFSTTLGAATAQVFGFADMDGDRDLDAIEYGGWQENLRGELHGNLRPMLDGTFIPDGLGNPAKIGGFTAGDLDGDKKADFVSMYYRPDPNADPYATSIGIGYNNGRGEIGAISTLAVPLVFSDLLGNPSTTFARIADFDNDGRDDLITLEQTSTDLLGNPIMTSRWRRNPGGGSRDPSSWIVSDLPLSVEKGFKRVDFDGNGTLEWSTPSGYLKFTPTGLEASQAYDFTGPVALNDGSIASPAYAIADFDADGDADFLYVESNRFYRPVPHLSLVRNTIIDERIPKPVPLFKWPVKLRR